MMCLCESRFNNVLAENPVRRNIKKSYRRIGAIGRGMARVTSPFVQVVVLQL
jgi:hypothetical protein